MLEMPNTKKNLEQPMLIITTDKYHPIVNEALSLSKEIGTIESNSGSGEELITLLIPLAKIIGAAFLSAGFGAFWKHLIQVISNASKKRDTEAKIVTPDQKEFEITSTTIKSFKITETAIIIEQSQADIVVIPILSTEDNID